MLPVRMQAMGKDTSEYRKPGLQAGSGPPIAIFIDNWRRSLPYSRNREVMDSLST
jgi:hypothetical protein